MVQLPVFDVGYAQVSVENLTFYYPDRINVKRKI